MSMMDSEKTACWREKVGRKTLENVNRTVRRSLDTSRDYLNFSLIQEPFLSKNPFPVGKVFLKGTFPEEARSMPATCPDIML